MTRALVAFFTVLLLSALVLDAIAFQYTLQAILPLSGNKSAQYRQWQSSAKLAASRVSAAWASSSSPIVSGDSLVVDFIDSQSDPVVAVHAAVAAMLNTSVMAVLTDADDASHAATILSTSSMPVITPDAEQSEFNTTGLGFYSMTPLDGASVNAFQALCSSYGWTKVGVAYIQTDTGAERTYLFTLEASRRRVNSTQAGILCPAAALVLRLFAHPLTPTFCTHFLRGHSNASHEPFSAHIDIFGHTLTEFDLFPLSARKLTHALFWKIGVMILRFPASPPSMIDSCCFDDLTSDLPCHSLARHH